MPKTTQECIKEMSVRGCPVREIARTLGVSRNTARKYSRDVDRSPAPDEAAPPRRPTMDGWGETAASWLAADARAPRKQRHTAKRVYDRLRDLGFEGSYSTVARFVREWRAEHPGGGEGFQELGWAPGTAQVDYGLATAVLAGRETEVHLLVVTLPHSNARYCVAARAQKSECLCDGLARVFERIGRAPHTLVLDNATEGGRRLNGVVSEAGMFTALRHHFGCAAEYCNPNSGHEKGSVENAVGFLRRNLLVPVPSAPDLAALNSALDAGCERLLDAPHYRKGRAVRELLAEDLAAMSPLPSARFEAARWVRRRADKCGRVRADGALYCAGPRWAGWELQVGLGAERVRVADARGRLLADLPRDWSGSGETVFDPANLLPAVVARPRSWPSSHLREHVPEALRDAVDRMGPTEARAALRAVQRASAHSGFEAAAGAAGAIAGSGRVPDDASVDALARRMAAGEGPLGGPDLAYYDGMTGGGRDGR